MVLNTNLHLKQIPKLIMTPLLQQAIKILQLTNLELAELIQQEMTENPLLEEVEGGEEIGVDEKGDEEREEKDDPLKRKLAEIDIDWQEYFQEASGCIDREWRGDEVRRFPEGQVSRPSSLAEHLLWQLRLSSFTEEEYKVGEAIIGNIDENGYLICPLEEIASMLNVDASLVAGTLSLIQTFEPPGVGARELKECLLLQLKTQGLNGSLAERIVENHLGDLEGRRYALIAKSLGVSLKAVERAARFIASLEPKPGRQFYSEEARYVIPDVIIERVDDDYVVMVNDEGFPRLRVSPYYRKLLEHKDSLPGQIREYLEGRLRSALWLIKSIEQRRRTLYRVTESIVKVQREFLDKGIAYLKPLVLRQIAEMIQMHESTVSRVIAHKYVQTPRGIFELKYFFSGGIGGEKGEVSSRSIKEMIRKTIASEDLSKPLSDQRIVEILKSKGINMARRTVAKYREELKILPASKRKYH